MLVLWHDMSFLVPATLGVIFLLPARRRALLSLGTVASITEYYLGRYELTNASDLLDPGNAFALIKVAIFVAMLVAALYSLYRFSKLIPSMPPAIRNHPILCLHAGVASLFAIMVVFPPIAAFAEIIPWLVWRIGYLLQAGQRGQNKETKLTDHLFYQWPIHTLSQIPFGKGIEYLSSCEATDAESDARSRLAGIKLLWLATFWECVMWLYEAAFFGNGNQYISLPFNFGLPILEQAIVAGVTSTSGAWQVVAVSFFHKVLFFAVMMHSIVGVIRLAGYNVYRGLYKPLLSESIVEFWGRFNYYFKTLMVEFFFYPVLLALKRVSPQVRMFLAVFAAAFIGNMYQHLFWSYKDLSTGDLLAIWHYWSPRMVYCALLALGVWISMVRQQNIRRNKAERTLFVRARAILGVWLFYATIQVWNQAFTPYGEDMTWEPRIAFSLKLVGIAP